jgi:hypothetical protein
MAMTPAEQSRPARKWPRSGSGVEEPFWAAAVAIVFLAGIIMLAKSALEVARTVASDGSDSASDVLPSLALCVLGMVIVIALLTAFWGHPRTRSAAASASFAIMKALMFLAGVVLFLGGALQIIKTTEFVEQVALALIALFYTVTPLSLHFIRT